MSKFEYEITESGWHKGKKIVKKPSGDGWELTSTCSDGNGEILFTWRREKESTTSLSYDALRELIAEALTSYSENMPEDYSANDFTASPKDAADLVLEALFDSGVLKNPDDEQF